ncbi:hypothetical protein DFH09DRAFT_1196937 [Mycena vulgaris]|nr:hypothetical protein DFH09DRAFT_1196937 [Mycena vulgaris]
MRAHILQHIRAHGIGMPRPRSPPSHRTRLGALGRARGPETRAARARAAVARRTRVRGMRTLSARARTRGGSSQPRTRGLSTSPASGSSRQARRRTPRARGSRRSRRACCRGLCLRPSPVVSHHPHPDPDSCRRAGRSTGPNPPSHCPIRATLTRSACRQLNAHAPAIRGAPAVSPRVRTSARAIAPLAPQVAGHLRACGDPSRVRHRVTVQSSVRPLLQ